MVDISILVRKKKFRGIAGYFSLLSLITACNGSGFAGGGGGGETPHNSPAVVSGPAGSLLANFQLSSGTQLLHMSGRFDPQSKAPVGAKDYSINYTLAPNTLTSTPSGGFPADLAQKIAASTMTATVTSSSTQANAYQVIINIQTHGVSSNGTSVPDQSISLTQSNAQPKWIKDEGAVSAFGQAASTTTPDPSNCKILPSSDQPHTGVYSVVLTQPAPCDFKMPSVKIGSFQMGGMVDVAIGTYWDGTSINMPTGLGVAHSFPLVTGPMNPNTNSAVVVDNGFILVQPDGTSYLLADAGMARPNFPRYRSAESIANDISQSLGFGATKLLQPNPSTTTFKKGSVVAIYDDTPDMNGNIDVTALVETATVGGMTLHWDAEVK